MPQPATTERGVPRASARLICPGLLFFVFATSGFGGPAGGEVEGGPQFQVSDVTTGYAYESQPSVAADADGNFVVVWRGGYEYYGPLYGRLIQGRRFGADGTPRGDQFQVSSSATGYAYESQPSVAAGADGDFVVVWGEYSSGLPYGRTIEGRRFAANGTPGGSQFRVSSSTAGYAYERDPSVAADADGNFVVVWRAYEYGLPYGPQILGRRFDANGTPGGPQFQVGSSTAGYVYESQPSVAADADGDFVVVWRDYYYYGPRYGPQIQGRRFGAGGTPRGPQFDVSSIATGYVYESQPSVAADADGDFVVVWRDYQYYYGPPYGRLIQGRRFAADGAPGGPQFQVSDVTTGYGYESQPSVAANEDGDFVVVWRDYQYPGPPSGFLVQGRRFAADGTSDGPQFHVGGASYYSEPSVASDAVGDFIVVWSDYQYPGPPQGYLIQGRQFDVGIGVDIDIMPSDPGNNLNLRAGKGASISVAVLSVDGFEAPSLIDPSTLKFGPGKATISGSPRARDVDGDGDEDLLVKFLTNETGIACGDTRASLSGLTFDALSISGSDATNTFNCPRNRKRY